MKHAYIKTILAITLAAAASIADARGGGSSGGHGGGGGHSSASGGRGGFSSTGRNSAAAPRQTNTASPSRTTTTTTHTTTHSRYVSSTPVAYGGLGMGYGYSNGLVTGMILGNMMHPNNTVVYAGSGMYNNNALLYPDGRVVNANGQQVGTYQNGQFVAIQNGPIVAQPIPQDALKPAEKETSVGEWLAIFFLIIAAIFLIAILIGLFL